MIFDVYSVTTLPIKELAITSTEWTYYAGIFMLGYALSRQTEWDRRLFPLYRGILLFAFLYILLYVGRNTYQDDHAISVILLNLLFLLAIVHIKIESRQIVLFAQISLIVTFLLLIQWVVLGLPLSGFQGYIRNPNIMGVFASCLLFFPVAGFRHVGSIQKGLFLLGMLMNLLIIYVSSARAVLLLLATVIGVKLVLSISRRLFSYLFYLVMVFNVLFLLVYGMLAKSPYFASLNEWSQEGFGKGFFSGRQNIWGPALEYGWKEPFFGHKVGVLPAEYIDGRYYVHAHNQYLQVFLESGLFGIAFFLLFLFAIWRIYQKGLDHTVVRWSACFFLGILVYQTVEISFFGNIEPIGLLQWMIIGLGLNGVYWSRKETISPAEDTSETIIGKRRTSKRKLLLRK